MRIVSPLTGGAATRIRGVPVAEIVALYAQDHKFDASPYLPKADTLAVWRCDASGLDFYAPAGHAGTPAFYAELYSKQGHNWGFAGTKWEFDVGARLVRGRRGVLDVGCSGGEFLAQIRKDGVSGVGLETSAFGRANAEAKGLTVYDEWIDQHLKRGVAYDAVTAFQVLEHVEQPAPFLRSLVDALAPGGLLILSVPNNDSFLKDCDNLSLNLPPHHVTLWSRRALEFLPQILSVDLVWIEKEPLQAENLGWYQSAMEAKYLPPSKLFRSAYFRFGGAAAYRRYLEAQRETIDGHTILAAYRKRA